MVAVPEAGLPAAVSTLPLNLTVSLTKMVDFDSARVAS